MRLSFTLRDSTALVTGASSGIGAEFVRQLAPYAKRLILVGRREESMRELVASLQPGFPFLQLDVFRADLSLPEERERLADWVVREQVPVNLLVNNAGLGDLGTFDSASWERLSAMLKLNVEALTHLTHLLLPMLRASRPAAILNVSSVAGFYPLPGLAVYAATKAYVTSFSEALRMELAPEGIRVCALCPGPVPTEFLEVASRPGLPVKTSERSHPLLHATTQEAVSAALRGVLRDRPTMIPNRLLALLVHLSLLLPFPLLRAVIRSGAGRGTNAQD